MKAIILARVSTGEQLKEGQSISAQLVRARKYCQRKGLEVKSEYQFDESSSKDHREKFEKILEEIKQSRERLALVVETIDRLQRSFKESVILDELRKQNQVEIHFLMENLIISINSNSSELLRWDTGVMFARSYVLQLSDNVKRSIEQKLRNGEWPGKAPYGYNNVIKENGKKWIEINIKEAQVVKKIYEWYSTRSYSMLEIKNKVKKVFGLDFSKSRIDFILKNPFYKGSFIYKGNEYPHNYDIIISSELYNKVQEIKAGYNKKHFKFAGLPFAYRGLLRCSICGSMVTPERKTKKTGKTYIYYHCTQYHKKHNAGWIREEELTKQFVDIFTKIKVPHAVVDSIVKALRETHKGKSEFYKSLLSRYKEDYQRYENRIENMYEDKLDGSITESFYDKKLKEYREKQQEIEDKITNLRSVDEKYYLTSEYLLKLASKAGQLFKSSKMEEKRQLIKLTLQNLRFDGKKVLYDCLKPFDILADYASRSAWLPR